MPLSHLSKDVLRIKRSGHTEATLLPWLPLAALSLNNFTGGIPVDWALPAKLQELWWVDGQLGGLGWAALPDFACLAPPAHV